MIKKILLIALTTFLMVPAAHSRDSKHMYPIDEAMQSADFRDQLDPKIKIYWGTQSHPAVTRSYGKYTTNKKTNAFNKSDREACEWVLLSALLSLQQRAHSEGGNAIINLTSYYKKKEVVDNERYECHAGNIIAGVALRGEVVKLAQ